MLKVLLNTLRQILSYINLIGIFGLLSCVFNTIIQNKTLYHTVVFQFSRYQHSCENHKYCPLVEKDQLFEKGRDLGESLFTKWEIFHIGFLER